MANISCPTALQCVPCPEGDPTNANLSAEKPDIETFFAIVHYSDIPPLGGSWDASQCTKVFTSTVSQQDADLQALAAAQECAWNAGNGWNTPPTIGHPNGQRRQIFANSPQSCQANCPDGTPFTFNLPGGLILSIISQVDADEKANNYACKQAAAQQLCLGPIKQFACQNAFYQDAIVADAGAFETASSSTWNIITGALPDGMAIFPTNDPFILTVQGTPGTMGLFVFTIMLTLDNGDSTSKTYQIEVGGISTSSPLPDAPTGAAYSQTLAATGLTAPLTWSVLVGPLPAGLTLDPATGIISGTPTATGTYAFTIAVEGS